jgi:hypothetical protein
VTAADTSWDYFKGNFISAKIDEVPEKANLSAFAMVLRIVVCF